VVAGLAASAEYWNDAGGTSTGFVSALYRDLLGRAASGGEAEYWAGLLTSGTSRFTVALSIASSAEAVGDGITAAYQAVVHTAPDPGGMAYWRNQIEQTGDPRPLLAALTASAAAWYG
jgi:hypothetical protein